MRILAISHDPTIFLSTPSARRATLVVFVFLVVSAISIHALREEGDDPESLRGHAKWISIHALREEGDTRRRSLSTMQTNFYPRPPRGGRHKELEAQGKLTFISIHALREEGDSKNRDKISIFL